MSQESSSLEFLPEGEVAAPTKRLKPVRKRAVSRPPRAQRPHRAPLEFPPLVLGVVALLGLAATVALIYVVAVEPVETIADPFAPFRLGVYALLLLGPALLFWALSRAMRMGLFWLYATAAWVAFGYLLIFVPPPPPQQAAALHYGLFLGALALALVALLTPPLYALGWVLFSQRLRRLDLGRAIRQAILVAAYIVLLIGMGLFGVFNLLNALLLFVVFALAEFFFLARS